MATVCIEHPWETCYLVASERRCGASEMSTKEAGRKPQVQHLQGGGQRGTPPYEHGFPSSSDLAY